MSQVWPARIATHIATTPPATRRAETSLTGSGNSNKSLTAATIGPESRPNKSGFCDVRDSSDGFEVAQHVGLVTQPALEVLELGMGDCSEITRRPGADRCRPHRDLDADGQEHDDH